MSDHTARAVGCASASASRNLAGALGSGSFATGAISDETTSARAATAASRNFRSTLSPWPPSAIRLEKIADDSSHCQCFLVTVTQGLGAKARRFFAVFLVAQTYIRPTGTAGARRATCASSRFLDNRDRQRRRADYLIAARSTALWAAWRPIFTSRVPTRLYADGSASRAGFAVHRRKQVRGPQCSVRIGRTTGNCIIPTATIATITVR
jgi:hypothetical protein